jgi:hypothetical protein
MSPSDSDPQVGSPGTDEMLDVIHLLNSKSPPGSPSQHDSSSSNTTTSTTTSSSSSRSYEGTTQPDQVEGASEQQQVPDSEDLDELGAQRKALQLCKQEGTKPQQQQEQQEEQQQQLEAAVDPQHKSQQEAEQTPEALVAVENSQAFVSASEGSASRGSSSGGPTCGSVKEMQEAAWVGYYSYWHGAAVMRVQRHWRARRERRAFLQQREAAVALQSMWR